MARFPLKNKIQPQSNFANKGQEEEYYSEILGELK